ncbi:MAG: methylmalonyl Co-A mutase-associated GTPase MeaB [Zetaproteobacteria bacterium]|nr:MAG: methylmalonyl Co-A mutase-associated GTPase MeaB [Zetaproteobacteria bacterium]
MDLVERILHGDSRATGRLITLVENGAPESVAALKELYPHTGRAYIIGVTGPPGSGKSTLTDRITGELRQFGKTVGIVAVDPTSPFTGGAILADRIRMQRHSLDEGVFIRSMATRGHLGGLARSTNDVVDVLDAMGKDYVLIETVGVGQAEVDIMRTAHTTVVVAVPGLGDEIQAIKAGIMEIGNVFVVNKADRDGADRTALEIEMMLEHGESDDGWRPKIFKTVAARGVGIEALTHGILEHRDFLFEEDGHRRKRRERTRWVFRGLLEERLTARALERIARQGGVDALVDRIAARATDPYSAVEEVLRGLGL